MLGSKDIKHSTFRHGRSIVEYYTHEASGWTLKVWTTFNANYKAMKSYVQEVKIDGGMELPIDGGIFQELQSLRCSRYSDKALSNAHSSAERMAIIAYGEHIKVGA